MMTYRDQQVSCQRRLDMCCMIGCSNSGREVLVERVGEYLLPKA